MLREEGVFQGEMKQPLSQCVLATQVWSPLLLPHRGRSPSPGDAVESPQGILGQESSFPVWPAAVVSITAGTVLTLKAYKSRDQSLHCPPSKDNTEGGVGTAVQSGKCRPPFTSHGIETAAQHGGSSSAGCSR